MPRCHGGASDDSNLALSCQGCNGYKHVATSAMDPVTEIEVPLYNPRQDVWADHFAWSNGFTEIIGRTPTGRATVERLRLNREAVVNLRIVLRLFERHPPNIRRE